MEEASNLQGTSQPSIAPASHQQQQSSSYTASEVIDPKSHVDTAAPIDSVEGAVTKFGGIILDWRERRKQAHDDCDKVREEATEHHRRSMEAEPGSAQVLQDLRTTTSAADKLRLSLKKAQIEEAQARQEAELADRRLRELQRRASERAAAKAELEGALADLQAARAELQSREKVCAAAAAEAAAVVARAREAAAESRETGKAVEDLAAELSALRAELESSHAALVEAEEKRLSLALALEQDKSQWQMELEDAQQEAKRLRAELMAACDVEMKAEAASELMANLKAELGDKPTVSSPPMLEKINKELQDVKASVERAKDEAKRLRVAAASMGDELAKEKAELAALRRREGLSSASIPSLNYELSRVTSELAAAEAAAKADNVESKMAERIGEARREAEEAKAKARSAREEVAKAREEAGVAKACVTTMEARLEAVKREILAATTSEEIATASAAALLQESKLSKKSQSKAVEGGVTVTLTVEEYDELSRRARETEEIAGKRVMEAVKLIKEAKDAEVRSLEKLAKQNRRTEQRRQALEAATLEAEEWEFGKLSAERELRQWHAQHDPQRRAAGETESPRAGLAEISVLNNPGAGDGRGNPHILSPRGGYMPRTELMASTTEADARQRKATFFPRMVMFLARKRAQSWK
ncbi:protein WEAK CHLOROPLAST MOVEMENT UNDER BLUE LIGHT 1-like [Panicum miliaceum]|uniref:Protein WEAK CHLOROPLAST MOVEMENT UNDER BLUE LIGHT 1-like n=1 Tax=Panicum miliaceum TaxID=4540 RepID=A0A3L6TRQ0_PANMI|nr:protein WEAK CHLOROPLAST MOVEMENT UNDER BLUE LIGHT 1-like [Panicum miliaceum]